jgi:hypothetical protein
MDGKVSVVVDIVAPGGAGKATAAVQSISKEAARVNKETQQQQKQTEKVIKESVKSIVDYDLKEEKRREREKKAIADRFIATVKQMERESKSAATNSGSAWSSAFGGALAGGAVGAGIGSILSGLRSIGSYATEASSKLFDMAKEASDFGRQLGGMQTVTGLSARTLSAFNLAANLSHKELSDLQRPLGFFVHNMGLAAEGNVKAAATMKALGVTNFKNLEQSLGQVLKRINDLPAGTEQMNAAMDAFSRRGGLDMIKIAAKMGGSLEETKKHADELGVSLSETDIQAARDFGKAYDVLGLQVKVIAAKIAYKYMPVITDKLQDATKWLSRNQDAWQAWGVSIGKTISGVFNILTRLTQYYETHPMLQYMMAIGGAGIPQGLSYLNKGVQSYASPDASTDVWVKSHGPAAKRGMPDRGPSLWAKSHGPGIKSDRDISDYLDMLSDTGGGGTGGGGRSSAKPKKEHVLSPAAQSIIAHANAIGVSPLDYATFLFYEGAGSLSTSQFGGKGGKYLGPMQMGTWEQGHYRVKPGMAFGSYLDKANAYLTDRGVTPGSDLLRLYTAINGGNVNVSPYARDANGTILQHVNQMAGGKARQQAEALLKGYSGGKTFGVDDLTKAAEQTSDLATAADKEKFYRGLIEIYKLTGILPTGDALDEIHKLMVDDAKKAGKSTFGLTPERTAAGFSLPGGQIPANTTGIYTGGITFRSQAESAAQLKDILAELDDTQFSLNDHTEEEILLRKIQLGQYPELTEDAQKFVLAKAKEIDATRAQQKADEEAKDAAQKYADEQQRAFEQTEDFFRNKLDTLVHGGPKSLWKSLLEDFKNQFVDKAANMLAQMFRGANPGQINGQGSSGPGWGGLFGNIFGGSGGGTGPLGGPDVNNPYILHAAGDGNVGIGGVRGGADVPGLPGGSAGGGFGGLRSLFAPQKNPFTGQMNGKLAGAMGGIGSIAAMVGGFVPGRLGKALQYGGMGAQIGSLFGPWGAAIGAGVGALFGLFGHHDDGIKKLKQAAAADFGINVSDKTTLKALNAVGEAMFGKGKVGPNADAVVRSEQGMNILRAYATSTGQSGLKIDRLNYGDPNWSGNDFRSSFGGFRAMGGSVRPGYSYIVGERGREMFTPTTGGTITPTASTTDMAKMMGELMRTLDGVQEAVAGLQGIPPGHVVSQGLKTHPEAAADAYEYAYHNDHTRIERLTKKMGANQ